MEGGWLVKQISQLTVYDLFAYQHHELFNKACYKIAQKFKNTFSPHNGKQFSCALQTLTLLSEAILNSNSSLVSFCPFALGVFVCVCVHRQQNTLIFAQTNILKKWYIHNWNLIENWNSVFIYVRLYLFRVIDMSYLLNSVIEVPSTVNSSFKCNCCM